MKKRWIVIPIAIVVVFVAVVAGAGVVFFQPPASNAAGPAWASGPDGYITSTATPSLSNITPTDSAGGPGWVQIHSTGNEPAYTNLSQDNNTIQAIRIHNPRVLKTYSSLHSPIVTQASQIAKYPNTVIMNASGYDMGGDNEAMGIQINNGQLIRDWPSTGLRYTFVVNKDGSTAVYDSSTSATQMLAAGAEQSYTFGTALYWNGKLQTQNEGQVNIEGHSWIGTDADNNLYLMGTPLGMPFQTILNFMESLHLKNLVEMDSGGSRKLSYLGKVMYPGDSRLVPDFIVAEAN